MCPRYPPSFAVAIRISRQSVEEPFFGAAQVLWVAWLILIPAFIIHIVAAIQLTSRDPASRPHAYKMRRNRESTLASRTMIWGGLFVLLFVIYYVLDFTFDTVNPVLAPTA
jgi:succinate dehydrogenase / fumarate reductase cytochrome b subunit